MQFETFATVIGRLLEKSSQKPFITSGMCGCGRKALILSRCKKCVQDDIINSEEVHSDGSGADVPAIGAVTVPTGVVNGCIRLVSLPLLQRARGAVAQGVDSCEGIWCGSQTVAVGLTVFPKPKVVHPFRIGFVDDGVAFVFCTVALIRQKSR